MPRDGHQYNSPSAESDVLIVGAGPTGLVLALWLARLGVRLRIIDKLPEPSTTSRALGVQARTLEFYRQVGLADHVVERSRRMMAANMWVAGHHVGRIVFGAMGKGISPFPYVTVFPQDEHEHFLIDQLRHYGVEVERNVTLMDFEDSGEHIRARLTKKNGSEDNIETAFIAGCDGAHSAVREAIGVGFPGGTYQHLFYVADVAGSGPTMNGEVHVGLDRTDFLAVFALKGEGRARLVGTVRDEHATEHTQLSWNDVSRRVIEWMKIQVDRVNWFSTYHVHHRVADHFRVGRAVLVGDAAHIHSPVGAQGMNTGIGDAVNLAWKIASVVHGSADESILDTYETERIAFARRLVATTDRAFAGVTSSSALARAIRLHLVPLTFPFLFSFESVRRLAFRTVSQTGINYRGSALSEGRVGRIRGGDRLPWFAFDDNGSDNFVPLDSLAWQVHVYGEPSALLRHACEELQLELHSFHWQTAMRRVGLVRDALYLVRPDGYVALAERHGDAEILRHFIESRRIVPAALGRVRPHAGV